MLRQGSLGVFPRCLARSPALSSRPPAKQASSERAAAGYGPPPGARARRSLVITRQRAIRLATTAAPSAGAEGRALRASQERRPRRSGSRLGERRFGAIRYVQRRVAVPRAFASEQDNTEPRNDFAIGLSTGHLRSTVGFRDPVELAGRLRELLHVVEVPAQRPLLSNGREPWMVSRNIWLRREISLAIWLDRAPVHPIYFARR